jgi:pimeloyl-ACP methyl ester carboxylesterase
MADVDRAFVRLAEGLVHYRHAGADKTGSVPLYLAHAGPGSSRGFGPLLSQFGESRWTIAPDMLGNGDSAAPDRDVTDIAYYADSVIRIIDALGIEQIDFYGSHTGALIGMELSRSHGGRIRKLVLDGVMLLPEQDRQKMLDRYAPAITPDDHGGYLLWAYQFCRDMTLFYPYFERDPEHRLPNGVTDPALLHLFVVDVLKALTTYHKAYGAAFAFEAEPALAAVSHPTLMTCSERDPLHTDLPIAARILPAAATHLHARTATPADVAAVALRFLDQMPTGE